MTFHLAQILTVMKPTKLNPTKTNGPDGIFNWLLKKNAELLSDPVKEILNSSFRAGCLPQSWKNADVVPLPKQEPVEDINKHLRPTSLNSVVSKVAQDFIVESIIRPAVLEKIDKSIWSNPQVFDNTCIGEYDR